MKKTLIVGMLGVLLGGVAGAGAQAQTPDTAVVKPTSIKIGAFFPSNGTVKSATHNTWFRAGIDYAFAKTTSTNPLLTSGYVDYAGSSGNGNNASLIGIGVAARDYFTTAATGANAVGSGTSVNPYAGAGIGVYIAHGSGSGSSVTSTQLGGKVFLGAELNTGPFIEVGYDIVPKSFSVAGSSIRADGFDASVGYRF
ncbi:MAG: outer membrane beta-barrel protein [Armatimonadetes bacterium]|nr:outer membrane beta-barrel protein [Armatimonadota bacterium]